MIKVERLLVWMEVTVRVVCVYVRDAAPELGKEALSAVV